MNKDFKKLKYVAATMLVAAAVIFIHSGKSELAEPKPVITNTTRFQAKSTPIIVEAFVDFQCPHCEKLMPILKNLADIPEKPDVRIRNFPLDKTCNPDIQGNSYPVSCEIAKASECIAPEKIQLLHKSALNGDFPTEDQVTLWVKENAGQDAVSCLSSEKTVKKIQLDISDGRRRGVRGTPVVFVNRLRVSDQLTYGSIYSAIKNARGKQ